MVEVAELLGLERWRLEPAVPCKLMFADPAYSRPINSAFVRFLVKCWNKDAAGVAYLSRHEDGTFAILDAHHRVRACLEVEGENATLSAKVWTGLSQTEEAKLWDNFNRFRNQPRSVYVFKNRVTAKDDTALRIAEAVERSGLQLDLQGRQQGPRSVVAVVALEHAFKRVGEHGLVVVLRILADAFDDERGLQAPPIEGLSIFWVKYEGAIDRARLVDTLQRIGATRMLAFANEYRALNLGMPLAGAWARVLLLQYNRRLRSGALPAWGD